MSEKQKNNQNAVKLVTPTYRGIGQAPERFCEEKTAIWDELVSSVQPDLWGSNDRTTLEILVDLLHAYRQDPLEMSAQKMNLIVKYQTQLGLSPLARSKIKQAKPSSDEKQKPKNKFHGL